LLENDTCHLQKTRLPVGKEKGCEGLAFATGSGTADVSDLVSIAKDFQDYLQ